MAGFARGVALVAAKDLRIELRGRHAMGTILPFAGTLLIAFGLSLGPGKRLLEDAAPGLLWLALLFGSVLSFRRSYEIEGEDAALEGLLLAPVDKAVVYLGKGAAVGLQLLVLQAFVLALVFVLFDLPLGESPGVLAGAVVLGTVGLSAVGCLFGVLTESPQARESVFPLLVLPLVTPIMVAGVKTTAVATGSGAGGAGQWLGLLAAFDVLFVAAGTLVFGYLLED
jgi:heme exporter protein B